MKALLELHLLQNVAPSNLNRDDTGSPKDAYFGGVRRGRISSQSLKRAIRMSFKNDLTDVISPEFLGIRTKRVLEALTGRLMDAGVEQEVAEKAVRAAITAMGSQKNFKFDSKTPNLTEYLFFVGTDELRRFAEIILNNLTELSKDKPGVSKELKVQLEDALDGGKAVDVALFGRMLANLPDANQYAACQVAHAISTHKIDHNEDFYTAVDDLKPDDNSGADMLGTVEFNSACYYRYSVIDLQKLLSNLQGDADLLLRGVEAYLRASIYALPSGKQNSFAAHQMPGFMGATVRVNASPRSLANAFEAPVRYSGKKLTEESVSALIDEWNDQEKVFGQGGSTFIVNRTRAPLKGVLESTAVDNVEGMIKRTLEQVKAALEL